jgi:hypothetical protein
MSFDPPPEPTPDPTSGSSSGDPSPKVLPATPFQAPDAPFLIVGITGSGRPFRPSDWADRLAGVMASLQPPGAGRGSHLHYSPYVVPSVHDGHKCVRVDPAIVAVEPLALTFLVNFARDNDLRIEPAG